MTMYPTAALFGDTGPAGETIDSIYGEAGLAHLRHLTELYPTQITSQNIEEHLPALHDLEVIFSTWGMFRLTPEQLSQLPNLRAVFYAAGSVKYFAIPLLDRGVVVSSAWVANALPVAEFTLGQILLANKGYFRNVCEYEERAEYRDAFRGRGNFGATVAILGAGQVGRHLIRLLRPFHLQVVVYDPFVTHKGAESLGAQKVETLEEAFARGDIVSNHMADVPETNNLLNGALFDSMPRNATFINTGRGGTVNQPEFFDVFESRPDLTALLDVTDPEPLPLEHPLRALPNVHISGHIAGSIGDELQRMGAHALREFEAWRTGAPLKHVVTKEMLDIMA